MRVPLQTRSKVIAAGLIAVGLLLVAYAVFKPAKPVPTKCVDRLALVDEAITKWMVAKGKTTVDVPTEAELARFVSNSEMLRCPNGGKISFGTRALATTCSAHGYAHLPKPPKPTELEYFFRM